MRKQMAQRMVRIGREVDDRLPERIGNKLVSAFKKNFREEGFFGTKWQDVKRRQGSGTKSVKKGGADSRRKILTGRTGNLGRSIQMVKERGRVIVYSDLAYSAAHNEGTQTAGRGHKTTIPRRQFIGDSAETNRIIKAELDKVLKE